MSIERIETMLKQIIARLDSIEKTINSPKVANLNRKKAEIRLVKNEDKLLD